MVSISPSHTKWSLFPPPTQSRLHIFSLQWAFLSLHILFSPFKTQTGLPFHCRGLPFKSTYWSLLFPHRNCLSISLQRSPCTLDSLFPLSTTHDCFIGLVLLLMHSQLYLWGSPFWARFFANFTLFSFYPIQRGSHIPSLWTVHAGCVSVAGLSPVYGMNVLSPWDGMHVCTDYTLVHTLIRKSLGGMESEPMLTPREKSPLPETQRRVKPMMLHHTGQQA